MRSLSLSRRRRTSWASLGLAVLLSASPVFGESTIRRAPVSRQVETIQPQAAAETRLADSPAESPVEQPATTPKLSAEMATTLHMLAKPDLVMHVAHPGSTSAPAVLTIQNLGPIDVNTPFQVYSYARLSCEAGKLLSPVAVQQPLIMVWGLEAGQSLSFSLFPATHWPSSGCYSLIRSEVDIGKLVAETNESNNLGSALTCHSDSCY